MYECTFFILDCIDAHGMQSGAISDGQLSASTSYNDFESARQSRLHNKGGGSYAGAWVPAKSDTNQWLQVDLLSEYTKVARVATQGRHSSNCYVNHWVTAYNLAYSDFAEDIKFRYFLEKGQSIRKVRFNEDYFM